MLCVDCAHAFSRSRDGHVGPCPARDFTGSERLCPTARGLSWLPLGYLELIGVRLTKDQAAEHAARILSLSAVKQLEDIVGTSIAKAQEKYGPLLATIKEAADEYQIVMGQRKGDAMTMTLAKATAVATIEEALTDELLKRSVLPLMGKKFGFRTDRDTGGAKPYPLETIRSCVCEVLLNGGRLDGNEFNVISGTTYFTKEFWQRKVEELAEVSAVDIKMGEVEIKPRKGFSREAADAYVEVIASWKVKRTEKEWRKVVENSKGRSFDNRVVVPMNQAMGRDAIIGKATARTYKAIYTLSGGAYLDASTETEEPDPIDVESHSVDPPLMEDPQDVADEQSRLTEEYVNLLGAADSTTEVDGVVKAASGEKTLLPETLEFIKEAGRQRWRQLESS